MSLASLSGIPIFHGILTVPFSGFWHADLVLAQATDISGVQTLDLDGTEWTCAYVRAIDFAGERGVRVVAGQGGWSSLIPPKQYGQGTIPTAMVLSDAAAACSEPTPVVDPSAPQTVGSGWLRQGGPASQTLQAVLGAGFWLDRAGVVQTAARSGTIAKTFQAIHVRGASGTYEITTDTPNEWMPGVSFSGPTVSGVVSRVMHKITRAMLRTEVMVP